MALLNRGIRDGKSALGRRGDRRDAPRRRVAEASPGRYEVVGKWTLTNPAGSGGIIEPDMQDDSVEVSCEEGDLLRSYQINDRSFLSDEHINYRGPTGVFVYPDFSKVGSADTKILEIRITCRPA
jgi:hypothetical protein